MARWVTVAALLAAFASCAAAGPRPPCEGAAPLPPYGAAGHAPNVRTWTNEAAGWTPPACLGWPAADFRILVAIAGRFRHEGDGAALLERFGAMSRREGLQYWSVTDQDWRVLITDAAALAAPEGPRRADFKAAEMTAGAELFYEERDNRSSGAVVYRMRVREAGRERLVIETENLTAVRALLFTLFPPGSLRAAYFAERLSPGTWGLYGLSSTGEEASALAAGSEASYVNRAKALYRHFADPTE